MRFLVAVLVGVVVALSPAPAQAHGDDRLVDETVVLAPGETIGFDGELHYHRLIGSFVADAPIAVRLVRGDTNSSVIDLGPGTDLTINRLVRCCDGRAWTPHRLEIENRGDLPATVRARATLVHDDLAVMVYRAEAGTAESVVVMGGLWLWALAGSRRRPAPRSTRRTVVTVGVTFGVILALGLYGAFRYGVGSAPALLAGIADVPVLPFNPLVSRASLLMGLAMIGWAVATHRWARSGRALAPTRWTVLGIVVVGAVAVTAWAVGTTYGTIAMPLAMAATAAVPVIGVMVLELRDRHADS